MALEPLMDELVELRRRVAELETADMGRKQVEEALKELLGTIERAKQEWESTADSLPDLICLVDDRGHIIRANRTVETWHLGRVTEVKGREFHELLHPGCADSSCYLNSFWKQAWEEAIRGQPAQCEAYDEVLKRHVLVQVQPSKRMANHFTVVVVRDITERKRAEEALKEYSGRLEEMVEQRTKELRETQEQLIRKEKLAAIGQLGASIGHELRNPLGVIKNSAYYLEMKLGDADEKVRKHLGIIDKEIARANKIIGDLMDFARVREPTLQKVDANHLVMEAISRSQIPENVEVITRLKKELPLLRADPDQIEQVFINLFTNARYSLEEKKSRDAGFKPELKVEVAIDGQMARVIVDDNGEGIAEYIRAKIFMPFFTTKPQEKGSGLGLHISSQILEKFKGKIELLDKDGPGARFRVSLPLARP